MPKEEQQENLKQISSLAQTMFELLENLLKWGRSQIGALEFNPTEFSLNQVVGDTIGIVSWNAKAKGITIENSLESDIKINADANMIATVLRNLLSNAIKFTNFGGKVAVSATCGDGNVTVLVKDNGIGISEEDQTKLFRIDSKFRNLGTAKESGTGLGLILCKDFVVNHGGEMIVRSAPGIGSTFGFTIKA